MIRIVQKGLVLWKLRAVRYVFFGALTTLVNLAVFFIFREILRVPLTASNVISVAAAILFAYLVNARFVFASEERKLSGKLREFFRFVGSRISTMIIEVGGVWLLVEIMGADDMISKILIQFAVLVLNYVFSRFLVFRGKQE